MLFAVSAMMQLAKQCAFEEPSVESISGENVLTWPEVVFPRSLSACDHQSLYALSCVNCAADCRFIIFVTK